MLKPFVTVVCTLIFFALIGRAKADENASRTVVARIDGIPVYHWRVFTSRLPNDVDRALVLREFHRRNLTMPSRFVDNELHRDAVAHYAGDETRLEASLERKGVTLADYRQFLSEEIIISAMLYHGPKVPQSEQAAWLARLRQGAHVELLPFNATKH